jgi:1-acyl-sn-glycerol-3-phosphate acyltransferase
MSGDLESGSEKNETRKRERTKTHSWFRPFVFSCFIPVGVKLMQDWQLKPARDLGMPPSQRFRSLRRESGLVETAAHVVWWSLVRVYLRIAHRLEIHGRKHIPSAPPFIMVANHASHLDALVLASPMPVRLRDQVFPIAAGDTFFDSPVRAAFAATALNALPIWRRKSSPHSLAELRARLLEEPCSYILFPEGTRSRNGSLAAFKPGLGCLVAETQVPVLPCYLDGTYQCLPPHHKFPRFHKIRLRIGEPLLFSSTPNTRPGWEEIARTCEAAVRKLAVSNQ